MKRRLKAFTLSELLVVLVIIGILVLLALPSLMPVITKARAVEAKQALRHLHTLQKTYFFEYSRYADQIEKTGFEQDGLVVDGTGNANYLVEIKEVTPNSYIATATAVVDFDGDGVFNVWQIDEKGNLSEIVND